VALTNLTPHTKKRLKPTDIIRFEWDEKRVIKKEGTEKITEKSTPERFNNLANKFNN
jgi:hypothetical protein